MIRALAQIGVAGSDRGRIVNLPPRFWLLVSLRRSFRGVRAEPQPWTYLLPETASTRRLEEWIAEVELRLLADARRRAWTATEAEWSGVSAVAIATVPMAPDFVVELPKKRTAGPTLQLLQRMGAGEILVASIQDGGRGYRLSPSGRAVRASVAERAIGERLLIPNCDGLFGPEWSQTWRAPPAVPEAADTDKPHRGTTRRRCAARGRKPAPANENAIGAAA